ncbi:MAG: HAMP domain-containing histidine kinase [Oscillospiraceae bacterium]|nr:HAMP domain-containing histidine kinase [Oscillospiraceae bacterium]
MSLRKKIILSTVLAVILPLSLILMIWAGYAHWGSGAYLKFINRASDDGDLLTEALNILYTFEAELSDLSLDVAAFPGENGTEVVVSPDRERIEELKSLGYHMQLETEESVAFSNMDESDRLILRETGTKAEGAVFWVGDSLIIQDSFLISGQNCSLTAVYNGDRADHGMQSSLLPMYMVSPTLIFVFLAIAICCTAFTTILIARWMSRSVLLPLDELKKGADMIAGGDLDYRISYSGCDEFGAVCSEFDHMRAQLKAAKEEQRQYEEERRDLLRGISHDLRSPLTSIKGYAMGLSEGIADTEEKRQRYYRAILTRTEDLERLTGSLSLLVRLEDDGSILQPEKVCLDEYIRQLLSEKESWLAERQIEVNYQTEDKNAEIALDIREMQRVFMNLFENTVKYRTAEQSRVELTVRIRGDEAEIRFSDDGPGVSQRHLKHLFDSFYRADESRTKPETGSGLGLAIAKRIVEGENGRIYAISENGLCIVMLLPLANTGKTRNA